MTLTYAAIALALVLICAVGLNYIFPEFTARQLLALRLKVMGFSDKRVGIPGFSIAYWEAGEGEPLVLVHGMGVDRGTMLDVAGKLKREFRVILPDLPGFGDSDKPEAGDYGIEAQVNHLRQFIEAIGLRQLHKKIFDRITADVAGYDLERRLPGIKAPTLLVWGDSDRLVPPSALQTFKRLIPNARPILLSGVGHVPQMEAIDRCATDYLAFRQSTGSRTG